MSVPWQVRVDTGGTFTDAWARNPSGDERRCKILSDGRLRLKLDRSDEGGWRSLVGDAAKWPDGILTGWRDPEGVEVSAHAAGRILYDGADDFVDLGGGEEAPVVAARILVGIPKGAPFPPLEMRVATTRGTNALLERSGAKVALFLSSGMTDLLAIRDQRRQLLFASRQPAPDHLAHWVGGVSGRIGPDGTELEPLNEDEIRRSARAALQAGCEVAAVALTHAWRSPIHEAQIVALLMDEGFPEVTASSRVAPLIRLLPRAETALTDAFLAPIMKGFVARVSQPLAGAELSFMTSAGGLVPEDRYHPKDSLLSGPAGGLIGAAEIGRSAGCHKLLTFDMGGTSTDVARVDGPFRYRQEQQIGPARVMAPAMRIETVAAGGGSICQWKHGRLQVGPESAGADPGPACYGRGGPLTLTDVNLLLGLMDPEKAGIPLDTKASERRFAELVADMKRDGEAVEDGSVLLRGLRDIAVETMAEAIRSVSIREGVEVSDHALLAFGGAGPQHAAAVAERLGIGTVLVPSDAGLLSAWGLERALRQEQVVRQVLRSLDPSDVEEVWQQLAFEAGEALALDAPRFRWLATIRIRGQESALDVESPDGSAQGLANEFRAVYQRTFGYEVSIERELEVVSQRVIGESRMGPVPGETFGGKRSVGPLLIQDSFSTCVVPKAWEVTTGDRGTLKLERVESEAQNMLKGSSEVVAAGLFRSRFEGLLEAMGEALKRTAISTNVKDRLDFSCGLLNAAGYLVASAPHVPVHLGALGVCVRKVASELSLDPGDVVITNDPGLGGSHLPDVTLIAPVHDSGGTLLGFVANRAHHAELGGLAPGSMPAAARNLAEEGVLIRPMKLVEKGRVRLDRLERLLRNAPYPSRRPEDNLADAEAQLAACHFARDALMTLADEHGAQQVARQLDGVIDRSSRLMAERLGERPIRNGASGTLDDGSRLKVRLESSEKGLTIDFDGSAGVHPGNLNATPAIVRSVVLYALRVWLDDDVPLNEGLLGPVEVVIPDGMLNPDFSGPPEVCPAVVGGNVETSQRLADLLLEALDVCAHGPGTMNNFLFGDDRFGYYETLSGGAGAGPNHAGMSGRHVHMTNTALTDPELMETRYPVRVIRHMLRRGSGGVGRYPGGDGVIREIEFLREVEVSFLTQRRVTSPRGLHGGGDGTTGRQVRIHPDGREEELAGIVTYRAEAGERVRIETPGGGGWGREGRDGAEGGRSDELS